MRYARGLAIAAGCQVGLVGRWVVGLAVGGAWYWATRGHVPQSVRAVVFAALAVGVVLALEWGRNTATRCPHCRKRHQPEATVCNHCGREVPGLSARV